MLTVIPCGVAALLLLILRCSKLYSVSLAQFIPSLVCVSLSLLFLNYQVANWNFRFFFLFFFSFPSTLELPNKRQVLFEGDARSPPGIFESIW